MNPTNVIIAIDAIDVAYEATNSYYQAALIALANFEAADTTDAAYKAIISHYQAAMAALPNFEAADTTDAAYKAIISHYQAAMAALPNFEAADTTFKAAYETLCVKRHGALEVNEIAHKYFMGIVDVIVAIRMGPSEANPIYKSLDKYEDVINTICHADTIYEFLASNTPHAILVK
jgi:hypothetical protein